MRPTHVLFVGASGSVGRYAVREGVTQGYRVRALVRDKSHECFGPNVEICEGDLKNAGDMRRALDGIDGIVFTMGANGGPTLNEDVDYGAVKNALDALDGCRARIALMTAIGLAADMDTEYNRTTQAHDWKRRSERLVRASGNEYTIVRPGWFDMEGDDEHHIRFQQDQRHVCTGPDDGAIARRQIAQTLVAALGCEEANRKTFNLVDELGQPQSDAELVPMFAALEADPQNGSLDGYDDPDNFPLHAQPKRVREELEHVEAMAHAAETTAHARH